MPQRCYHPLLLCVPFLILDSCLFFCGFTNQMVREDMTLPGRRRLPFSKRSGSRTLRRACGRGGQTEMHKKRNRFFPEKSGRSPAIRTFCGKTAIPILIVIDSAVNYNACFLILGFTFFTFIPTDVWAKQREAKKQKRPVPSRGGCCAPWACSCW